MTMYVADKTQMQPLAGQAIGQWQLKLLAWISRRRAQNTGLRTSEYIKSPDEIRADFEAPMHGQRPPLSLLAMCVPSPFRP